MVTITLKINERTKIGQLLLDYVKLIASKNKDVEVIKTLNAETIKVIEDAKKGIGINKAKNSADLFKQLGI